MQWLTGFWPVPACPWRLRAASRCLTSLVPASRSTSPPGRQPHQDHLSLRPQETGDEWCRSAILLGDKPGPRARPASSRIMDTFAGPPNRATVTGPRCLTVRVRAGAMVW
jgi:hypothetical protein